MFEVDDLLQEWTWSEPFDFIYLRHMLGSFDDEGWDTLYKRCYEFVMHLSYSFPADVTQYHDPRTNFSSF
jgi:chemotaxis methyl-accepting protein methylase